MKYEEAKLIKFDEIAKDKLGNPVLARNEFATIKIRPTFWTAEEVQLEGREVTTTSRKYVSKASKSSVRQATHILFDGVDYEIKKVEDLTRWRLIIVKLPKGAK